MSETALANLRHTYAQLVNGGVKDSAQAERLACGLISPAIQALEATSLETAQLQARVAELEGALDKLHSVGVLSVGELGDDPEVVEAQKAGMRAMENRLDA